MLNHKLDLIPSRFINHNGDKGTIKWMGKVPGKDGEYFGIDWDDPKRGKHNGNGLFTTHHASSGSFLSVRSKNGPKVLGRGFLTALREKYLSHVSSNSPIYLGSSHKVVVETVGWEKMQNRLASLNHLTHVGLADMQISFGEEGIESICSLIEDIDLSRNLFASLNDVASICLQLPKLQVLRLSYNRIIIPNRSLESSFRQVKVLTCIECLTCWSDVLLFHTHFPGLTELHAGWNCIDSITGLTFEHFPNLTCLNLEHNHIRSWDELESLGLLSNLQTLNVSHNQISSAKSTAKFKALNTLNISFNRLSTWMDIDMFNRIPSLLNLRISNNPILDSIDPENRHIFLVARLRYVTRLGGSFVSLSDRRNAECYYLSQAHLSKDDKDFQVQHPRYVELCSIHGTPTSKKAETTIAEGLIMVKFIMPDGAIKMQKKLSKNLSLRVLKTLVARSLWPSEWQQQVKGDLIWISSGKVELNLKGVDDSKSVEYMEVKSGDSFTIK